MSWVAAAIGGSAALSLYQGNQAKQQAKGAANATRDTAAQAEALNRERFALAQQYMDPYIGRANIAAQQLQAELGLPQYVPQAPVYNAPQAAVPGGGGGSSGIGNALNAIAPLSGASQIMDFMGGIGARVNDPSAFARFTGQSFDVSPPGQPATGQPYMPELAMEAQQPGQPPAQTFTPRSMANIPGYQAVMDESRRAAEQSAMSSGSTLYGGRRLEAAGQVGAGVQQSYYNNYMNLLQNMANPATATNLAGMGVGQGQSIGQQNLAATGMANDYRMQGIGAQNAAISDVLGGGAQLLSGYMAGGGRFGGGGTGFGGSGADYFGNPSGNISSGSYFLP